MIVSAYPHRLRAARPHQGEDHPDRLLGGAGFRAEHPWAAEEKVGASCGGTGTFPPRQRMPGHERGEVTAGGTGLRQRAPLDAPHIGVPPGQALALGGGQDRRNGFRRHGEHGEVSLPAGGTPGGQDRARADLGGQLRGSRIAVGQSDLPAPLAHRQRDRRPDQTGADDD